jgi:predicted metal-dependent hydrolase
MIQPHLPQPYFAGIQLFNQGAFWHAHEAWEACWLAAAEPDKTFYQALIQVAAALVKWQQGNLRGLRLNWAKSRSRLLVLPPTFHGLDLIALRDSMDLLVAGRRTTPPTLEMPTLAQTDP